MLSAPEGEEAGVKHGSLCTGYGGLDMAAQRVFGGGLAWWSDVDPGPIKAMEHHHPGVPNLGDLKTINWSAVEPVDILTAGYPCQPFSNAGKRKGTDDPRHLWPWIAYGIAQLRPRVVVLENVGAHLRRGFPVVAADLAALGYRVSWTLLRASDVGAAHRRERLFIVATNTDHSTSERASRSRQGPSARPGSPGRSSGEAPADAASLGRGERGAEPAGLLRRPDAPERGVPTDKLMLLLTPTATDASGCSSLLPTPTAVSYGNNRGGAAGRVGKVRPSIEGIVRTLLPSPTVGNVTGGNKTRSGARSDELLLPGVAEKVTAGGGVDWQEYEPAIRRWESVLGREAPYPATRGPRGGVKVAPAFGEWLMGLPAGHITDVPGLSINEQLKLVGNGVVPQQAEHAIQYLAPFLGLL